VGLAREIAKTAAPARMRSSTDTVPTERRGTKGRVPFLLDQLHHRIAKARTGLLVDRAKLSPW